MLSRMESGPALCLRSVGRRYVTAAEEVWAVRHVDLEIGFGELVGLMGASGSGKTTLIGLCAGLDDATTGSVLVAGADLGAMSQNERADLRLSSIGVVFQDNNLIDELSAMENVALPLEVAGLPRRRAWEMAGKALAACDVAELAGRRPGELSGGQQQRVGIARALVGDRRILLADEPTGALDRGNTRQLFELIRRRCDGGVAAVIATHDASVAAYADRVVEIEDGRLALSGAR